MRSEGTGDVKGESSALLSIYERATKRLKVSYIGLLKRYIDRRGSSRQRQMFARVTVSRGHNDWGSSESFAHRKHRGADFCSAI